MGKRVVDLPPNQSQMFYNGRLTAPWQNWFNNQYQVNNQFFKSFSTAPDPASQVVPPATPLLVNPGYTTAQRDAWVDVQDGTQFYNTTTKKMNFRENGSWMEV